jgi:hypothetical protein
MSYEDVYAQILRKRPRDRQIAENALRWLLCGKHQLKSSAFIQAVLYSEGKPNELDHVEPESLLNLCCNLIVLDSNLDIFRLAHLSVREYFEKKAEFDKFQLHTMATKACVSTIISNSEKIQTLNRKELFRDFLVYAIFFSRGHCTASGPYDAQTNLKRILVSIASPEKDAGTALDEWSTVIGKIQKLGREWYRSMETDPSACPGRCGMGD